MMSTATARMSTAEYRALDLGEDSRRHYLWAGEVVHQMPPDVPHSTVVFVIATLLRRIFGEDSYMVWTEQPLALREGYDPQPDVMVIRGTPETRGLRPPTPADLLMLVEVADSSLVIDLYKKPPEYAGQGIAPYLVADVRGRRVIVFTGPDRLTGRYGHYAEYGRGDRVPVGDATIAVDDVFRCLD